MFAAYLYNQDVNVVAVSWATLAGSLLHYSRAVSYTMAVGKEIAQLIDFLVTEGGADISSFHLTGHSLGAHVVSFASNYVTSGSISRISGEQRFDSSNNENEKVVRVLRVSNLRLLGLQTM